LSRSGVSGGLTTSGFLCKVDGNEVIMRTRIFVISLLLLGGGLFAEPDGSKGCVEINVHYSGWTLDLMRGMIEDKLGDVLEDNLREEYLKKVRSDFPDAQELSYSQTLRFESSGKNYGVEFRWYPKGPGGSFSIGMAVEKTNMRLSFPEVTSRMTVYSPAYNRTGELVAAATKATAELNPLSFHFSFRWDIMPSWRLHPYCTFGFGFFSVHALERGELHAGYAAALTVTGVGAKNYSDSIEKTVKEAVDESNEDGEDIELPPLLPIVQLNVGVKFEVTDNIHLLLDAGIWDGFLLRGGLAIRF
jgi:hypothetical protein